MRSKYKKILSKSLSCSCTEFRTKNTLLPKVHSHSMINLNSPSNFLIHGGCNFQRKSCANYIFSIFQLDFNSTERTYKVMKITKNEKKPLEFNPSQDGGSLNKLNLYGNYMTLENTNRLIFFGGLSSGHVTGHEVYSFNLTKKEELYKIKLIDGGKFKKTLSRFFIYYSGLFSRKDKKIFIFGGVKSNYNSFLHVVDVQKGVIFPYEDIVFPPCFIRLRDCSVDWVDEYEEEAILFGGGYVNKKDNFSGKPVNDVFIFSFKKKSITKVNCYGNVPEGTCQHSSKVHKNKLYLFGGIISCNMDNMTYVLTNDFYQLDLKTFFWRKINIFGSYTPSPRAFHSMEFLENRNGTEFVVYGGFDGENSLSDVFSLKIDDIKMRMTEKCVKILNRKKFVDILVFV